MNTESKHTPKNIAIIGSGISGLTCAYVLSRQHNVTVFEANDYIGGHTATKNITVKNQEYAVDTGFIVYNDWTYPNFIKLMNTIGVSNQKTEMSFSVNARDKDYEYSGNNLNTLFAQRGNLFNSKHWRMLKDIVRFNKTAIADLESGGLPADITLGDYLKQGNYSEYFWNRYLIPMGSAIWSASEKTMRDFPLVFFIRFFKNHGLLSVNNRPQWRVIKGGSSQYIEPLIEKFKHNIFLNTPVLSVTRIAANQHEPNIELRTHKGSYKFDEVIFACHSDTALKILNDANQAEQSILSAIPYQNNSVILHTDISLLPKRKQAWASWNYQLTDKLDLPPILTYNMNILQGLNCPETLCVSLNAEQQIDPAKIIQKFEYAHPQFTLEGIQAQNRWHEINGHHNTWFVGAYWHNGFHEDGVKSALKVCSTFGLEL